MYEIRRLRKYEKNTFMQYNGGKQYSVQRNDLLYPDLSFAINGALFEVFRQLGGGHQEKYYQKAVALALKKKQLSFTEQYYVPIKFDRHIVGKYFLDFFIEESIILELKRGKFVPHKIIDQTKQYLQSLNKQLALIACFTEQGVFTKRIINIKQ